MNSFKYKNEIENHLIYDIIPFWKKLRDDEFGGYYGYVDYDLNIDATAPKGCILNSRILWFFANAYACLCDETLLEEAEHAFEFLKNRFWDKENGGVFWETDYKGTPSDTLKHTYNQAFAIYALSSYYDASRNSEAIELAYELFNTIENKCTDEGGYLEAFSADWKPESNEKLSENGVMAERTMNTLLHVFEAYTELYRVTKKKSVADRMKWILDAFAEKVYDGKLRRQKVFFDLKYNSIIDLHSYGHDIETAWLIDRGTDVLDSSEYRDKLSVITKELESCVYSTAFDGHSLANECEKGKVDETRVWWVQAEGIVGFLNGYSKNTEKKEYLEAAEALWEFIKTNVIDSRSREWYMHVDKAGKSDTALPIVDPWKCPYHNGRMCMEVMRRV